MWHKFPSSPLQRDAKPHSALAFFSCSLAVLIPAVIGAYWPIYAVSEDAAIALLRPLLLTASLLLALLWYGMPASTAEIQLGSVLALLAGLLLIPSAAAVDPIRAFAGWTKLLLLGAMSLLLARALRHQATAECFGVALLVASVVVGIFTLLTYIRFIGFVIPSYTLTREFKGIAERAGVPLNAIPFTSVFAFLLGMCLVRANCLLWTTGVALFLVSSLFTGSRAPFAVLVLSGLLFLLLRAVRSRTLAIRFISYVTALALPLAAALVIAHIPFRQMSSLTEGRWDLWYVAFRKFAERPLLGSGFGTWHDDLASLLPGAYSLTRYMAKNIIGGYHNEYLTLLAEEGLIGFLPAAVLIYFVVRACTKAAFQRWYTWQSGAWALFACFFLLVRAGLEIPGLFGEGSEPADFLAYIFLAIVASRFSIEEDFLRANTPSAESTVSSHRHEYAQPARYFGWPQSCNVPVGSNRSHV